MGNFCILKSAALAIAVLFGTALSQDTPATLVVGGRDGTLLLRDLVTETLVRGLSATEITPVPSDSPACLLIAGMTGPDGTLVVNSRVRLLSVTGDLDRTILRQLSVKFGASGLKIGPELVMLTSKLEWLKAGSGAVLNLGFERGPFNGFFSGAPRIADGLRLARAGDELCVAAL